MNSLVHFHRARIAMEHIRFGEMSSCDAAQSICSDDDMCAEGLAGRKHRSASVWVNGRDVCVESYLGTEGRCVAARYKKRRRSSS